MSRLRRLSFMRETETPPRLGAALAREREHRRVLWPPMEFHSARAHVFKCVCCGKPRRVEERREPRSDVCSRCMRAAGFRR